MNQGTRECLEGSASVICQSSITKIPIKLERDLIDCYAGNSSETAVWRHDLAAAVHRQGAFVNKMCHMLWLRSPAVKHTLENARIRYGNFFALFRLYPGKMIMPTLDIDLVWHTHQLSPTQYYDFCIEKTGRFINHDDKIGKRKLDDSLAETKDFYYKGFAESFQICLCWHCEAIREAIATNPSNNDKELEALMKGVRERVARYRAAEIARRLGVQQAQKQAATTVAANRQTNSARFIPFTSLPYARRGTSARYR